MLGTSFHHFRRQIPSGPVRGPVLAAAALIALLLLATALISREDEGWRAHLAGGFAVSLLAVLLLLVGLVVVAARRRGRRMEALILGIRRIAGGDLTCRLPVHPGDEIGELGQACNRMTDFLRAKEKALQRSNTFLEGVIDSSVDGIIAADMKGNIILFNAASERMLGYRAEEVMGKVHITTLYPPGLAREIMRRLRSPEHGEPGKLSKMEAALVHKNGETIPVDISAAIVREQQEERASVGIFTDLRERKRFEQQLIRSEKLSSLGGLAAGIAHEMNQPLTGILTFTHLLLDRFPEEGDVRRDLEVIEREASRCARIIRGVLDFARERQPTKVLQDLNALAESTVSLVERQVGFMNIRICREWQTEPCPLMLDPDQIQQVILNLLLNAADAMAEEGGRLWVRTRAGDGCAELEVEDTGIGIPEENLVRIFDPFFTTKEQRKGVGLGLSVSYGIVKAHRGELAVRSRPGRGTIFTVRLPLIQENSAGG